MAQPGRPAAASRSAGLLACDGDADVSVRDQHGVTGKGPQRVDARLFERDGGLERTRGPTVTLHSFFPLLIPVGLELGVRGPAKHAPEQRQVVPRGGRLRVLRDIVRNGRSVVRRHQRRIAAPGRRVRIPLRYWTRQFVVGHLRRQRHRLSDLDGCMTRLHGQGRPPVDVEFIDTPPEPGAVVRRNRVHVDFPLRLQPAIGVLRAPVRRQLPDKLAVLRKIGRHEYLELIPVRARIEIGGLPAIGFSRREKIVLPHRHVGTFAVVPVQIAEMEPVASVVVAGPSFEDGLDILPRIEALLRLRRDRHVAATDLRRGAACPAKQQHHYTTGERRHRHPPADRLHGHVRIPFRSGITSVETTPRRLL